MSFIRYIILVVILMLPQTGAIANELSYSNPMVLAPGEELVYKVKYLFLKVGNLHITNLGETAFDGDRLTRLQIRVDSSPGIPFITIHDIYESYVDADLVPRVFYAWEKKGDYTLKTDYVFNYRDSLAYVYEGKIYKDTTIVTKQDTVVLHAVNRDVLSLLFFAREQASENYENIIIPTFILGGQDSCFFRRTGEIKELKFEGKKVNTYYLKGKVKFIGIAGIKDKFEGWFSGDKQRVPLKAKMKAFFGSITIQLTEYKNWQR